MVSAADCEVPGGYRVDTLISLDDAERRRLLDGAFAPDSRSVMFRFPEAEKSEDGDMFGAIIESIDELPDSRLRVGLRFWSDRAPVHATAGATFEVWYVRTSGKGVVLP